MTAFPTLLHNGRFFQSSGTKGEKYSFAECVVVDASGIISHVGSLGDAEVADAMKAGATRHDMNGRIVLPGFFDGHIHLMTLGNSLKAVPLDDCKDLEDICATIKQWAAANPNESMISCKGWMYSMLGDKEAVSSMINDLDPRPIFISEKSLHSVWCNTAALEEMKVQDMPDPEGGSIHRDADGNPTGLLSEAAVMLIFWPHLARRASMPEKVAVLKAAIDTYNAAGYTGAIDMALDENALEAIRVYRQKHAPTTLRLAAYWLITPKPTAAENLAQVDRAIELARELTHEASPGFRVVGIKIICDGIIDACTASLTEPYSSNGLSVDPLWSPADLAPVVAKADAAGLQIALHAIGDRSIRYAIDALEQHATSPSSSKKDKRHRIEHLELAMPADAARLGRLGITASIQPVHSDPAILRAWPKLLGPRRLPRAFAYRDFAASGAVLALGSDAPTAPHAPLRNIYTATTRRSAREPDLDAVVNPQFALGLAAAVAAATVGSAYSCFEEGRAGRIERGLSADFAVVEMEWRAEELLDSQVVQTWFQGKVVYDAGV